MLCLITHHTSHVTHHTSHITPYIQGGFKRRVLHEATDERVPLLERLKLIAIVSGNIDEFFMKRVGGLKQQIGAGVRDLTPDGRTPRQQVQECYSVVRELEREKNVLLNRVLTLLSPKGISICRF